MCSHEKFHEKWFILKTFLKFLAQTGSVHSQWEAHGGFWFYPFRSSNISEHKSAHFCISMKLWCADMSILSIYALFFIARVPIINWSILE